MTQSLPGAEPRTNPDPPLFAVAVSGHPLPGFDAAQVRATLQQRLKLPPATAERLLAGRPMTLKRGLTAAQAEAYAGRLRAAGLAVTVEPQTASPPQSSIQSPTPPPAATAPQFFRDRTPLANPVALAHRLRLWPQTLQLAALPLAYGLAILLVLVATLAFAIGYADSLRTPPLFFALPVYLLPLLAGLGLFALLLRPLLPTRARRDAATPVDLTTEPALHALLDELCAKLGAPLPAELTLDLGSEVTLDLLPGRDGWQRGHYRLCVGLPLLQRADLPVLVGTLAAALVFAREPALLRLRVLIARLRGWLETQATGSADAISERLAARPRLAQADVATRRQLGRLFTALAARSSRAAEATIVMIGDDAAAALVGGAGLAPRLLALHHLDHARERALVKHAERRIDTRPVDDLPALIGFFLDHLDAAFGQRLTQATEAGDAARHPALSDRARLARSGHDTPAVLTATGALPLQHGTTFARGCTEAFYAAHGIAVGDRLPAERMLDDALLDLEQAEAGARYFNQWLLPARGWRLPDVALLRELPHADAREQLNVCVNEVRRLTPDRARLRAELTRVQAQLGELLLGQQVLAAQHAFAFRYLKHDGSSLTPLIDQRQREIAKIQDQLATQESIMGGRIALGLKLFGQDGAETEALHRALDFLGEQEKALYRLEQDTTLLEQLLERQRTQKERGYTDAIARLSEKVRDAGQRLLDRAQDAPNPPDRRYAPMRDFLAERSDARSDGVQAGDAAARARALLDGFYTLNEKLSLLAAEQASSVEEAYRIERIRLVGAE